MLIGWDRGHCFSITKRVAWFLDPDWLSARQQQVGFPLKLVFKKFRAKYNASEFWMQLFHQLWQKIGMQKWIWNCGIERGLFNRNSRKNIIFDLTAGVSRRVEIHGGWVWNVTSRRLIFKTEATLSPRNSKRLVGTYSFGCEKKNGSSKES